jgi:hypothetical protein
MVDDGRLTFVFDPHTTAQSRRQRECTAKDDRANVQIGELANICGKIEDT